MPLLPATLSQNIIVDTALGNQTLAVTYAGAGAATFAITGITYTVNGVSSVAIPDLTFTYAPPVQILTNPPPAYNTLSYSLSATVTIGGKYSLSIFDQNEISSIPRGGTDKESSTIAYATSFTGLAANNRQVFKLSPDNRTIPVVYTVAYVLKVTIAGTAATTIGSVTTAATSGSETYTLQTATVTQTVINNYDALGAALLLVISSSAPVPITYKIFSGSTTTNSEVCINNGAEVKYSYTSVSAGSGIAIFYSKTPWRDHLTCTLNTAIEITACLPADAIIWELRNGSIPISGTTPRITPTLQVAACSGALPLLLTTVNNTIDNLILTLS